MNNAPDEGAAWGPSSTEVRALIDRIAGSFSAGEHAAEIRGAREAFDQERGRVFDDDELYPQHMARFLEWYSLERELKGEGAPPVVKLLRRGGLQGECELALALARSHISIFEVVACHGRSLRVYDLVGSSFWKVRIAGPAVGLGPRDIAEVRLIPWRHEVALGPAMIFHPPTAHQAIHRLVEERTAAGRIDASIVADLAEMRLRFARYRNMAIEHIYKERSTRGGGVERL
ncbi:MAG: hypothetical protein JRH20_08640 [Deltaproteobacteria bacterium]|nr:hypothetical protein [Deltaproteobacteria bacterium]